MTATQPKGSVVMHITTPKEFSKLPNYRLTKSQEDSLIKLSSCGKVFEVKEDFIVRVKKSNNEYSFYLFERKEKEVIITVYECFNETLDVVVQAICQEKNYTLTLTGTIKPVEKGRNPNSINELNREATEACRLITAILKCKALEPRLFRKGKKKNVHVEEAVLSDYERRIVLRRAHTRKTRNGYCYVKKTAYLRKI